MNKKKGFTLVELLVVIAIIALLLAIVTPSLRMAREHAQRMICGTNLRSMGTGFSVYAEDNDDYLPPTRYTLIGSGESEPSPFRSYWAYSIDASRPYGQHIRNTWGVGYLYSAQLIESPEVFYCPSTPRTIDSLTGEVFHYDGYHDLSHPWPWNNQNDRDRRDVRIPYTYLPQAARERDEWGHPAVALRTSQQHSGSTMMTDLLQSRMVLAHTRGLRSGSGTATGRGVNALYSDGSVRFRNNAEAFAEELWSPSPSRHNRNFRAILRLLQ